MFSNKQKYTIYALLFLVFLLFVAISFRIFKLNRPYNPKIVLSSVHFTIESNSSLILAKESLRLAEKLYGSYVKYANKIGVELKAPDQKHQLRLYKNKSEFRAFNVGATWAEAYYFNYRSHFYINKGVKSPFHWMVHEITHQLNKELAGFQVNQWLEEGIVSYFSTSFINDQGIVLGSLDKNTYPIWWYSQFSFSKDLKQSLALKNVISFKALISGRGGPRLNTSFNKYYIHWCSLVHF